MPSRKSPKSGACSLFGIAVFPHGVYAGVSQRCGLIGGPLATRYAPDGTHAHCPKCEQVRAFARYETTAKRPCWTCTGCGHHLHPTAGTIFHKSSTSLHLWFYAMYLMTSTRCGISAKQLERDWA